MPVKGFPYNRLRRRSVGPEPTIDYQRARKNRHLLRLYKAQWRASWIAKGWMTLVATIVSAAFALLWFSDAEAADNTPWFLAIALLAIPCCFGLVTLMAFAFQGLLFRLEHPDLAPQQSNWRH